MGSDPCPNKVECLTLRQQRLFRPCQDDEAAPMVEAGTKAVKAGGLHVIQGQR